MDKHFTNIFFNLHNSLNRLVSLISILQCSLKKAKPKEAKKKKLHGVLIFYHCYNKLPKIWWLKTIQITILPFSRSEL